MRKNVMIVKIELVPCFGGELCLDRVEQWLTTQVHNRAIIVTDVTDKVEAMEKACDDADFTVDWLQEHLEKE